MKMPVTKNKNILSYRKFKYMRKIIFSVLAIILMASCSGNSEKIKQLQYENDSLTAVTTQTKEEFDQLLSTLNIIEDGFDKIKEQENYLVIQSQSSDINLSAQQRLKDDIDFINQTLIKNKEELEKLKKLYNQSNLKSQQMKNKIDKLTEDLDQKTARINMLQEELAKKDVEISKLNSALKEYTGMVSQLNVENQQQRTTIKTQDKELNRGWYVFGTKSELKEQGIISGGGLFNKKKLLETGFNKDYFTPVDVRNFKELPLEAPKAKVLTNMPEGSYALIKGDNKNLTLVITDYKAFWSLSKYLVIEVDL